MGHIRQISLIALVGLMGGPLMLSATGQTPITKAWAQYSENKQHSAYAGLTWDLCGPVFNSGRVESLDAAPGRPGVIYAGFGSGNLWKTDNHGLTWKPVFDNYPGYSIGDVKIAPSDSNVVYLATGENLRARRGHTFVGAGVFRSDDAGETWKSLGLEDTFHIGRVAVHPKDPNIVFVAALGHFFSPNKERGLFKSVNGGSSWSKVLFVDERIGASDVIFSPSDPLIMYASTWQCSESIGGPGSSVFKSTDGGEHWTKINQGLPNGKMNGRTGLAVSYQDSNIVYALTDNVNLLGESDTGELYRSDDGGQSWIKPHKSNLKIFSSFGHVFTDCYVNPKNHDEVYALGITLLRSRDGGKSFQQIGGKVSHVHPNPVNVLHLDHHDMWINPNDPDHIILGNDGGLYISYDSTNTWMHYNNIPVGEFYFVRTDNHTPYCIYSGTQDNAAVRGPARILKEFRSDGWEYVWIDPWGGGDGIVTTPDPKDPDTVYYESQRGDLVRKHMPTGRKTFIKPKLPKEEKSTLFHEWLTPYIVSQHDRLTLYYGANYIFKSGNRGDSWSRASPDLSKSEDARRCGNGVTALLESPIKQGLLYAGTSKGAAWVTKDDGKTWTEISNNLPASYIKSFAPSRFNPARVYAALSDIGKDDFTPLVYCSEDFGENWKSISSNLPEAPVNVILEDPTQDQILYCGTFNGVFISMNRGQSWHVLGSDMPHCFVADMTIQDREKDLIAATHGRGVFKLDLAPLYGFLAAPSKEARFVYTTKAVLPKKDASGQKYDLSSYDPVKFHAVLPLAESLQMEITDADKKVVYISTVTSVKGLNVFFWDLIVERIKDDNPYHYKTVVFPKAGEYGVRLHGPNTDIETVFSIVGP